MKKSTLFAGISLLTFSTLAAAAVQITAPASATTSMPPASDSSVPQTGFFAGLGGSYNSVAIDQTLSGTGITNVYSGSTLVAYGEAVGPAPEYENTQQTFAPEAQLGYFQHFNESNYLWGVKFFYQYLGTTSTNSSIDAPQTGSFTNTDAAPANTTFTGNAIAESSQLMTNDEMALMPFIGRSFKNSYVYLGVGPSLFDTEAKVNNLRCFADINGTHTDISGTPINTSDTQWVWGGAAQIGMAYYLNSTWYIDANYTYARSADYDTDNTVPFTSYSSGYTHSGTVALVESQHATVQTFALSINKVFA